MPGESHPVDVAWVSPNVECGAMRNQEWGLEGIAVEGRWGKSVIEFDIRGGEIGEGCWEMLRRGGQSQSSEKMACEE
jgi:hypothetical protein